jgi:predicted small lipoprotein YifL
MMVRAMIVVGFVVSLAGCGPNGPITMRPVINSGSYDWTDQVRGPDGNPLPGWGNIIEPSGGTGYGD